MLRVKSQWAFPNLHVAWLIHAVNDFALGAIGYKVQGAYPYRHAAGTTVTAWAISELAATTETTLDQRAVNRGVYMLWRYGDLGSCLSIRQITAIVGRSRIKLEQGIGQSGIVNIRHSASLNKTPEIKNAAVRGVL